jgi:hypothetical protein
MSNANKHQKDEDHLSKYSHDECFNLLKKNLIKNTISDCHVFCINYYIIFISFPYLMGELYYIFKILYSGLNQF